MSGSIDADEALLHRLRTVSHQARNLFCVVVRQAFHGPMHPKLPGVAKPPEILEACGLDVGEFYSLLKSLESARLVDVLGDYPFEEIRLAAEASAAQGIAERCMERDVPLQDIFVDLDFTLLRK